MAGRRRLAALIVATLSAGVSAVASRAEDDAVAARHLFAAKDVDAALLRSDGRVAVAEAADHFAFGPASGPAAETALLFFPGGGVDPIAYVPLVRAVAAEGFLVRLVKLSFEIGPADAHKRRAIDRGKSVIEAEPRVRRWVVAGHSMGGAIAAQFAREDEERFAGFVLVGTTHPRDFDLSRFPGDATKIVGTLDRVAKLEQCEAGRSLLPAATTWVRVEGGNHAQFGSYGPQPGDGAATIAPEEQRRQTSEALVAALRRAEAGAGRALPPVKAYGSLRGMLHEGEVGAAVRLESLLPNERLYALGALEDLAGEITVLGGVAHLAFPEGETRTRAETTTSPKAGAALLVAAEVAEWEAVVLEKGVAFEALDAAIRDLARGAGLDPSERIPFLVEGEVENLEWHVIDGSRLPAGPSSHEEHVAAAVRERRDRAKATLVGFHSQKDMATFTHMGSTTHIHCVVPEASSSGHVDRVALPPGTRVLFPKTRR